jgi:hypothetical protein
VLASCGGGRFEQNFFAVICPSEKSYPEAVNFYRFGVVLKIKPSWES